LHGHTYKLRVTVEGKLNQNGIIIDFGDLKAIVNKHVVDVLDHKFLNDIFVNPTAEMMAKGIFNTIKKYLPEGVKLCMVELWETPTSKAIVIP
jgi:6-pyruvoyltetrahydropterin/6-carboxytetrahydropterin synthase